MPGVHRSLTVKVSVRSPGPLIGNAVKYKLSYYIFFKKEVSTASELPCLCAVSCRFSGSTGVLAFG